MVTSVETAKRVRTHRIHNFTRKLLQRSIYNRLKRYVEWQIKLKEGKNVVMPKLQPISINLDLTTGCNYYCDHCIDLGMINNGGKLQLANIKQMVTSLVKDGLRSTIVIGGGEPVLHPDFEEVIVFLKSLKLQVGIVTNGSRLAPLSRIAFFMEEHDWIRLSLDAGKNDTFRKIHSPKVGVTLDGILNDVKEMRSKYAGYQLGFSYLVLSQDQIANNKNLVSNIREIPLAAKKAKQSGFDYFAIKPFISPFPSRFTEIQKDYISQIKEQVARAKRLEDDNFKVVESLNLLALFDNVNERLRRQTKICHAQFFRWVVTPDGIFNCPAWRGFAKAYFLDTEQRISKKYFKELKGRLRERIEDFNAAKECSKVSCIYNDMNWFIDHLIKNPDKLKKLAPVGDYGDYFV